MQHEVVDVAENTEGKLIDFELLAVLLAEALLCGLQHLAADIFPSFTGFHAFGQGLQCETHVAVKDEVEVDLLAAAVYDLDRHLTENVAQTVRRVVVLGEVEDHLHGPKDLAHDVLDLFGLGFREAFARLLQHLEELKVVDGLLGVGFNLVLEREKRVKVITRFGALQDVNDLGDVLSDELLTDICEVQCQCTPEFDLCQRTLVLAGALAAVLLADNVLDLFRPVSDSELEALEQVSVVVGVLKLCLGHVLNGHIQNGRTFHAIGTFREVGQELVHVGGEILLDAVRPRAVAKQRRRKNELHEAQKRLHARAVHNTT
eukprot:PhM_4_TR1281/c1_g1_i1/m.7221